MKTLLLAGVMSLALSPVLAQDNGATCYPYAALIHDLEEAGAKVVGAASYHGTQTDELIVVESADVISIVGFKDGCYVGTMEIEPAVPQKDA